MWAPDQWKVNKGKIVIRRSQSSTTPNVSEYKTDLDSGSHSMDSGFRVLDSSLFQWNLDSRFHSLVGYLKKCKTLCYGRYCVVLYNGFFSH